MKVLFDQKTLKSLLADLSLVVPIKEARSNPMTTQIKVIAGEGEVAFFATDIESFMTLKLKAEVLDKGMCTVPAKTFLTLVKNFSNDAPIKIEILDSTRMRVSQNRSRFNLPIMEATTFPKMLIPTGDFSPISSEALLDVIDKTSYATATDGNNMAFHSVSLENTDEEGFMRGVATDGRRLATCKAPGVLGGPLLLHKKAVAVLTKLLPKREELGIWNDSDSSVAHFKFDDGYLSVRLMDVKFANWTSIFERFNSEFSLIKFNRDEFTAVLKRVLPFTKDSKLVEVAIDEEGAVFKSQSPLGEAVEELSYEEETTLVTPIKVNFNGQYLIQAAEKLDGKTFTLRIYNENSPALLQCSHTLALVMPCIQ